MAQAQNELSKEEMDIVKKLSSTLLPEKPIAEILGIPQERLDGVYAVGYHLYQAGKYEQVLPLFHFLVMSKSTEMTYWKAFASTLQALKKYDEAIYAYSYCTFLDFQDATVPLHAGECYLQKGNVDMAKTAFQGAEYFAKENLAKYADVAKEAARYLQAINKVVE